MSTDVNNCHFDKHSKLSDDQMLEMYLESDEHKEYRRGIAMAGLVMLIAIGLYRQYAITNNRFLEFFLLLFQVLIVVALISILKINWIYLEMVRDDAEFKIWKLEHLIKN